MRCHAGPRRHTVPAGVCAWRWYDFGVDLYCDDAVVPGSDMCAEHLIQSTVMRPELDIPGPPK